MRKLIFILTVFLTGFSLSANTAVNSYEYGPFGQVIAKTETVENPYQYNTKYFDEETNLLYYGYRFYDDKDGRWINRDPIG